MGSNWGGSAGGPGEAARIGNTITRNLAAQNMARTGQRFDQRAGLQERLSRQTPQRLQQYVAPPAPYFSPRQETVSTGIDPGLLYSQASIQRMANREFGRAMADADPRLAQKQFMGRGLSLDAGTLASATPQIADGRMRALLSRHVMPLADQMQNQQFLLDGQQAQGAEFLGLGNILRQQQQNAFAQQQMGINPLLQIAMGY